MILPVEPAHLSLLRETQLRATQLRAMLRQKYPEAHRGPSPGQNPVPATGADGFSLSLAEALALPILQGQFTEITGGGSSPACAGIGLILHHLLEQASAAGRGIVLVDGADRFDPGSYPAPLCRNLFWARCHELASTPHPASSAPATRTALKVADLFLRDGNLPLVILDLFHTPEPELARVNLSIWYRLRQLTEQTGCGLCLLTARATGPAAHRRLALAASFGLDALDLPRAALLPQLRLRLERAQPQRLRQAASQAASSRRIA